jgi:ribosome-associated heat shock protein Hsp15
VTELTRQRLDKWLWHARMARTRTLAAKLVTDGYVRIGGKRVDDPARGVRIGDVLTLALRHATLVVIVDGFAVRRGPAEEARRLYLPLESPENTPAGVAQRDDAPLAPDKKNL